LSNSDQTPQSKPGGTIVHDCDVTCLASQCNEKSG